MSNHPRTSPRTILIIAAAIMMALFAIPKSADAQQYDKKFTAGEIFNLRAVCSPGTSFEQVRAAILMEDWKLYAKLMKDSKIKCWDITFMPGRSRSKAMFVTIVEDFCTIGGIHGLFIRFKSRAGADIISWTSIKTSCPRRASMNKL